MSEASRKRQARADLKYYIKLYLDFAEFAHKRKEYRRSWFALLNWAELNRRLNRGNK